MSPEQAVKAILYTAFILFVFYYVGTWKSWSMAFFVTSVISLIAIGCNIGGIL